MYELAWQHAQHKHRNECKYQVCLKTHTWLAKDGRERESERKNNFSVKVNIFSTAFQFLWDAAFFSLYIYATAATAVVGWHIARMLLLLRFGWTNNRPKDPHAHQHIFYRASNIHRKYICTSKNIYSLDDYSDSTNQQQYKESDGIRRRE